MWACSTGWTLRLKTTIDEWHEDRSRCKYRGFPGATHWHGFTFAKEAF